MKRNLSKTVLALFLFSSVAIRAQDRTHTLDSLLDWHAEDTLSVERITYPDFIARVMAHNLDYAVQKYNVSIAEAEILVAKVYPDPAFTASFDKDITGGLPSDSLYGNIMSVGASQTIVLGGKISHGVRVAEQNKNAAAATVQEFFWTLRAAAASAYVVAAIADSNYTAALRAYRNLVELAEVNFTRMGAGDLGKIDYIQSRVDAIEARAPVFQTDAARRVAFLEMGQFMGGTHDAMYAPAGPLEVPERTFDEDTLIAHAKESRWDIIAAEHQLESAREGIDLARAMRWPDLTVGIGYTQIGATAANPSPFPQEREVGVNISVPIPISPAINRGSLDVAEGTFEQSRDSLTALRLNVETSVRQAFAQYELARDQYQQYSTDLLANAEDVRNARLYSYKAGNSELLDVLTAENTLATVFQAYYSALSNYANALIQLEEASNVWDITF